MGIPFLLLGVLTAFGANRGTLVGYQASVLSSCFTLALGAISVSFVVFQLAPYRNLVAGAPRRQLAGGVAVAAIAVMPVAGLLFSSDVATRLAIGAIPMLICASVLLVGLAQREAEPVAMTDRRASDQRVLAYCSAAVEGLRERLAVEERLDALRRAQEPRLPPPMHEIFRHLAPRATGDDPFDFLASLAAAALERRDVATYVMVVERTIGALRAVRELELTMAEDERHRVLASLVDRATAALADVAGIALNDAAPTTFADRCVDICADHLRAATESGLQGADASFDLWFVAADAAASLLKRGHERALIEVLVVGHHAAEAGLINVAKWQEQYALSSYPASIAALGRCAIEAGNVEALYRVLEALGWIGCAAVLRNGHDVGTAAIHGLVQLGREARKSKLECFWSRCFLAPVDHADERIGWVASWVPSLEEANRERWLSSLGCAWSRLRGHQVAVELDDTAPSPRIIMTEQTERPYIESANDNGRLRSYDYSDLEMMKDLVLR